MEQVIQEIKDKLTLNKVSFKEFNDKIQVNMIGDFFYLIDTKAFDLSLIKKDNFSCMFRTKFTTISKFTRLNIHFINVDYTVATIPFIELEKVN